jgi:hypothetical protein
VKDVGASYAALLDLFESIGNFVQRLEIYTEIPRTTAITNMVTKIIVELLSTLALATKEIKRGRLSESILPDRPVSLKRRREIWNEAVGRERRRGDAEEAR